MTTLNGILKELNELHVEIINKNNETRSIIENIEEGNYDMVELLQNELNMIQTEMTKMVSVLDVIKDKFIQVEQKKLLPKTTLTTPQTISNVWTFDGIKTNEFGVNLFLELKFNNDFLTTNPGSLNVVDPNTYSFSLSDQKSLFVILFNDFSDKTINVIYHDESGSFTQLSLDTLHNKTYCFERNYNSDGNRIYWSIRTLFYGTD